MIIRLNNLSSYKRAALKFGLNGHLFSSFNKAAKLGNTNFPGGKFMEIVMAWMLGYYIHETGVFCYIGINEELDKKFGIDFDITTRDAGNVGIDLKFDKDVDASGSSKRIVCIYPNKKGHSSSGRTMTGEEALRRMLSEVFYPGTLDNSLSEREDFLSAINKVWSQYSVGW